MSVVFILISREWPAALGVSKVVGQFSRDRDIRADKEKAGPDQVGRMLHGEVGRG